MLPHPSLLLCLLCPPQPLSEVQLTDCALEVPHEQLRCRVPPGLGFNYAWSLSVKGLSSPQYSVLTMYGTPFITPPLAPSIGSGAGGHYVVVRGVQLGYNGIELSSITLKLGGVGLNNGLSIVSGCEMR